MCAPSLLVTCVCVCVCLHILKHGWGGVIFGESKKCYYIKLQNKHNCSNECNISLRALALPVGFDSRCCMMLHDPVKSNQKRIWKLHNKVALQLLFLPGGHIKGHVMSQPTLYT